MCVCVCVLVEEIDDMDFSLRFHSSRSKPNFANINNFAINSR